MRAIGIAVHDEQAHLVAALKGCFSSTCNVGADADGQLGVRFIGGNGRGYRRYGVIASSARHAAEHGHADRGYKRRFFHNLFHNNKF